MNSLYNQAQIFLFFVSNWHFSMLHFVYTAFCLSTVCPNQDFGSICSISLYEVIEDSTKSHLSFSVHLCWTPASTSLLFLYWRSQDCTEGSRCGLTKQEQREQSLALPCWLHLCNALLCSWLPLPQENTADKQKLSSYP